MSRFVSAGTQDAYVPNDDDWAKAEQQIERTKNQKAEGKSAEEDKSLYEVLQANKAAKQEAFEEKIKLKNQFRTLDEDEVDFLDSVLESTRNQEAVVKKDTREQVDAFRKHQKAASKAVVSGEGGEELQEDEEQWTVSKKRKRSQAKGVFNGVKLRKSSSADKQEAIQNQKAQPMRDRPKSTIVEREPARGPTESGQKSPADPQGAEKISLPAPDKRATAPGLGLVSYGSESDE